MKADYFKKEYSKLDQGVHHAFNELLKEVGSIDFIKSMTNIKENEVEDLYKELEETDQWNALPILEMRNDMTGNVFDVHIMKVTENGLWTAKMDDTETTNWYKFSDLSSIYDRISLLSDMEDCKND